MASSRPRPQWARRIAAERHMREWTQAQAVAALRLHCDRTLPQDDVMLTQWKRWESGKVYPDQYTAEIAATFGTVTNAIFPDERRRDGNAEIVAVSGMETFEIVNRLQRSDLDSATLEGLRITADRLCSEYPYMSSERLLAEGRTWLRKITAIQEQRLTFEQHREILALAGWIALLVGCVEYDMGARSEAETTRRAASSLGHETDNRDISGWAHEMRAWFALTSGDYRGVVVAAQAGTDLAGDRSVAVQLAAQEAKAWARIGDRRQTEVALDRGRRLLESLPYPENLDNHFVVDPAKFDFYAMDCYRMLGENKLAGGLAEAVITAGTDFDGVERSPMRITEARITLGVVAAREGDLERALAYGHHALDASRQSLPSLGLVGRELAAVLTERYGDEPMARAYLDRLRAASHMPSGLVSVKDSQDEEDSDDGQA